MGGTVLGEDEGEGDEEDEAPGADVGWDPIAGRAGIWFFYWGLPWPDLGERPKN